MRPKRLDDRLGVCWCVLRDFHGFRLAELFRGLVPRRRYLLALRRAMHRLDTTQTAFDEAGNTHMRYPIQDSTKN